MLHYRATTGAMNVTLSQSLVHLITVIAVATRPLSWSSMMDSSIHCKSTNVLGVTASLGNGRQSNLHRNVALRVFSGISPCGPVVM